MGNLSDYKGGKLLKGLIVGDPGTAKTGGLVSLVKAGYKLRIYDFDNLLQSLIKQIEKHCPDKKDLVKVQTFTDKLKGSSPQMNAGNLVIPSPVDGTATAYRRCLEQLNYWKDGAEDLGKPQDWGNDTFVIIDTLTSCAKAAYRYCDGMNPGAKDKRAIFFAAQQLVMNLLNQLASESFNTNVLVLAHLDYEVDNLQQTKGFPRSIGGAIKTEIASGFNCVLLCESQGTRRVVRTQSTGIVDLKNPAPYDVGDNLPIDSAYATVAKAIIN